MQWHGGTSTRHTPCAIQLLVAWFLSPAGRGSSFPPPDPVPPSGSTGASGRNGENQKWQRYDGTYSKIYGRRKRYCTRRVRGNHKQGVEEDNSRNGNQMCGFWFLDGGCKGKPQIRKQKIRSTKRLSDTDLSARGADGCWGFVRCLGCSEGGAQNKN